MLAVYHAGWFAHDRPDRSSISKAFVEQGMRAYGDLVQEPEVEQGVDVVTHQKWSGANYVDGLLTMVTGGTNSTVAMGAGVTEDQFK